MNYWEDWGRTLPPKTKPPGSSYCFASGCLMMAHMARVVSRIFWLNESFHLNKSKAGSFSVPVLSQNLESFHRARRQNLLYSEIIWNKELPGTSWPSVYKWLDINWMMNQIFI